MLTVKSLIMQLKLLFVKSNVNNPLSIPALEQPVLECYILYILIHNLIFSCFSSKVNVLKKHSKSRRDTDQSK